ncbi:MAG: NAD(P)-dependent oxidoreductase [Candidatus Sumerlaeia bacterium]|nr:NAD(P)-dependent oxidoreductase [Candidatus Sumerlaeia bacterium]
MSTRRALVTGATGFLGGHLCERLRAEGWTVDALVRPGSNRKVLRAAGCQLVDGDVGQTNVIARAAEAADAVFHLAGLTQSATAAGFMEVNAEGTASVVTGLERAGFEGRLVVVSSLAAGGPAPAGRPRVESDKDAPISDYGRSKLAGEQAVLTRPRRFATAIVRPGAIYGPRERGILEVFRGIARHGVALKPNLPLSLQMTHVDDIVSAVIAALEVASADAPPRFYTVEPEVWTYEDVCHEAADALGRKLRILNVPVWAAKVVGNTVDGIERLTGRKVAPLGRDKVREMEAVAWLADSAAFRAATGWRAAVPFPEGVASTLEWAKKAGQL